jgi:hypothetical protein
MAVALIAGSVATAAALVGAIVAFVISRTVGLARGADDIGNWTEPLGLARRPQRRGPRLTARSILEPAGSTFPGRRLCATTVPFFRVRE